MADEPIGPLSEEHKRVFRETVHKKLDELLEAHDAEVTIKTGINYVFAIAVPNDPAKRKLLVELEAMMKRNFGF